MNSAIPVITVDGPSGTGKGTLCLRLATVLGWHLLDSGLLYRVLALAAQKHGLSLDDEAALGVLAQGLELNFVMAEEARDPLRVSLEGQDVTVAIRTEAAGNAASRVAALPAVRAGLLERQHAFRQAPGLIADGRDMGTVVFPAAPLKLFLTASAGERAQRRYKQLKGKGMGVSLPQLVTEIAERDARDSERSISPLRPAPDAVVIDTTAMDIAVVFEQVTALIEGRLGISLT